MTQASEDVAGKQRALDAVVAEMRAAQEAEQAARAEHDRRAAEANDVGREINALRHQQQLLMSEKQQLAQAAADSLALLRARCPFLFLVSSALPSLRHSLLALLNCPPFSTLYALLSRNPMSRPPPCPYRIRDCPSACPYVRIRVSAGPNMSRMVAEVQRRSREFSAPPVGPVGRFVRLNNPQFKLVRCLGFLYPRVCALSSVTARCVGRLRPLLSA